MNVSGGSSAGGLEVELGKSQRILRIWLGRVQFTSVVNIFKNIFTW